MTRVGVVGPGRAGTAVALAADGAGYHVSRVTGRSSASLDRFSGLLPSARVVELGEVSRGVDLVVLAVPDDVLGEVLRDLAVADAVSEEQRWVHLAGRHGLAVLEPVRLAGARVAACHPAQAIADASVGAEVLSGCAWAVTAPPPERVWARRLVRDLGGQPVDVADRDRLTYHLAAALGANGVSAVVSLARDLLLGIGVTDPAALLGPLVSQAAGAAASDGPAALTGPVRRGDADTVAAHLAEMEEVLPEARPVYCELARLALGQARRAGLAPADADRVEQVLDASSGAP